MAITQVTTPLSVPATNADWTNMTYHLKANRLGLNNQPFILTNDDNTSIPALAIGSYIQLGDSLYIVDTEDYTIQGTPVDGNNYIRIEPSGTNLIATWIQDKSSYAWNPVNNYYEIAVSDYALLPYIVVKNGTEYTKTFLFANFSIPVSTFGTKEMTSGSIWQVPQGIYMISTYRACDLLLSNDSGGTLVSSISNGSMIVSDGINVRIQDDSGTSHTISYRKFF